MLIVAAVGSTDGLVVWATAELGVWIVIGALIATGGRALNDIELPFDGIEGDAGPPTVDRSPIAMFCGIAINALRRANSAASRFARRRARYRRHHARERWRFDFFCVICVLCLMPCAEFANGSITPTESTSISDIAIVLSMFGFLLD